MLVASATTESLSAAVRIRFQPSPRDGIIRAISSRPWKGRTKIKPSIRDEDRSVARQNGLWFFIHLIPSAEALGYSQSSATRTKSLVTITRSE
jgi:hypothetical protein